MNKSEALAQFYQKNNINIRRASDSYDGNYDKRIAGLDSQVDAWLAHINPAQHGLFLRLLSRYTYLTEAQCQIRYEEVLSLLQQELDSLSLQLKEVLVVTIESSGGLKSGGDNVRADLHKRSLDRLSKRQIVAAQSKLCADNLRHYRAVVFVDDIIGSGITLWGEIRRFHCSFLKDNPNPPHLFYACIAPRKSGIKQIQRNCKKSKIEAKPLINDNWYTEPAFNYGSDEYNQAAPWEQMIDAYMQEDGKSFFMGFNKNRLLLSFHYNTPNNTLCSFWRVTPDSAPPFYRDGNQPPRPSVDSLKKHKQALGDRAYAYGIERQRRESDDGG